MSVTNPVSNEADPANLDTRSDGGAGGRFAGLRRPVQQPLTVWYLLALSVWGMVMGVLTTATVERAIEWSGLVVFGLMAVFLLLLLVHHAVVLGGDWSG